MAGYIGSKAVNLSTTGADINGDANIDGDLSFRDNDKIKLGAGSDLQIFHDGSNSYIKDVGTGNFELSSNGDGFYFRDGSSNYLLTLSNGGPAQLYHNGSAKLATTSTGIDVTGTITADSLTVENTGGSTLNINTNLAGVDSKILLHEGSTASPANGASIRYAGATNEFSIGVGSSVDTKRLSIARDTGDISFYEDTGTTAKFFWDASAESLGIGTTSPTNGKIEISNSTDGYESVRVNDSRATPSANKRTMDLRYTGTNGRTASNTQMLYLYDSNASSTQPFIQVDGSSSTHLVLDSSGRVGIGTSSPARTFEVYSTAPAIKLNNGTNAFTIGTGAFVDGSNSLVFFDEGVGERMRITSAGHLQLSGSTDNVIRSGLDSSRVRIFGGGTESVGNGAALTLQGVSHSGGNYADLASATGGYINFRIGTSNAMRLDASGNLIVGDTSAGGVTSGGKFYATPSSGIYAAANADNAGYFNRNGSEGSIVEFRTGNAPVGSIGVFSGNNLYIGGSVSGHAGLQFGGSQINPMQPAGTVADNVVDFGAPTERFKDLYLSGGVYLGGTGAANKLEDYEEGTWTPSITNHSGSTSGQTVGGRYTKIGNICHFQGVLTQGSGSISGAVHLAGFPFSAAGTFGHISINQSSNSNLQMSSCRVVSGANSFQIKEFDGDSVTSGTGDVNICFEGTFQVT